MECILILNSVAKYWAFFAEGEAIFCILVLHVGPLSDDGK